MISVIIGTYGDDDWRQLAWSRAYPSVPRTDEPTAVWRDGLLVFPSTEIIVVHGETLAQARNQGAQHATNPWLCFLDADDELTDGYLQTMTTVIRAFGRDVGDRLFTPRVQYVGQGGREEEPLFHPEVPIEQGNWLVIGTCVPRALFIEVGGFEEWEKYEDWALFARMQLAGGKPVKVPGATYRAHRNPHGRNHAGGTDANRRAHTAIREAIFG